MCLVNLVGHDVPLRASDDGWRVWCTLPATDVVAAVVAGVVTDLPKPDWCGVMAYLVSPEVAAACPARRDLWVESDDVRDPNGEWTRHRGIKRAHAS
jgi:hypothetical protein